MHVFPPLRALTAPGWPLNSASLVSRRTGSSRSHHHHLDPVINPSFTVTLGRRSFSHTCVSEPPGSFPESGKWKVWRVLRQKIPSTVTGGRQQILMEDLTGRRDAAAIRDLSGKC